MVRVWERWRMQASTYTATHHGHPECTPPAHEKWTPRSRTRLDSAWYTRSTHRGPPETWDILAGWLRVRLARRIYLDLTTWLLTMSDLTSRTVSTKCIEKLDSFRLVYCPMFATGIESNARFRRAEIPFSNENNILLEKVINKFQTQYLRDFRCLLITSRWY